MSVSLSQKFSKSVKLKDKFLIAYGNTDEIFAVAVSQKGDVGKKYMWGLILLPVVGWTGGTLVGAVAGNILPQIIVSALGLAIYGMFTAIVVPVAKKEKTTALCVLLSIVLSCAFKYVPALSVVPSGFTVIICAVTASLIFALVAPINIPNEEAAENE
jgi:predicted branched-subunit amino acid permease